MTKLEGTCVHVRTCVREVIQCVRSVGECLGEEEGRVCCHVCTCVCV